MNNFNYKKALLYSPPLLILIFVFAYYLTNKNYLKRNPVILNNPETKKVTYTDDMSVVNNAFNDNDFVTANKILDEKLYKNSKDIETLLAKARTLAQEASITFKEKTLGDEAMIYIEQALKLDPKNVEALTLKGYVFEIQENYSKAHENYDLALSINPKSVETLAQKAHAYDLQGNLKDAETYYKKAIVFEPDNPKILSGYSRILIFNNKIDEAKKTLSKILAVEKNSRSLAETYTLLGSISETQKFSPDVENMYVQAIKLDSTLPMSYVGLAKENFKDFLQDPNVVSKQKKLDSSFANLETALKLNPNQSYASLQLAIELWATGNQDFAKKVLTRLEKNVYNDITLNRKDQENIQAIAQNLLKAKR